MLFAPFHLLHLQRRLATLLRMQNIICDSAFIPDQLDYLTLWRARWTVERLASSSLGRARAWKILGPTPFASLHVILFVDLPS